MKNFINQLTRPFEGQLIPGEEFKIIIRKEETVADSSNLTYSSFSDKPGKSIEVGKEYVITVKKYMTQQATPSFDFMKNWNNNIPMPFVTMVGRVIKETRGMYQMELHAEPMKTSHCLACGRPLTNKISMLYGLGPECGQHAYINPFETEEDLEKHLEEIQSNMRKITWNGWVIKSSIKEFEEVK